MNRKTETQIDLKDEEGLDQQIYELLIERGWLIPQTEEEVRLAEAALDQSSCSPLPAALADPSHLIHRLNESDEKNDENALGAAENSKAEAAANLSSVIPFRPADSGAPSEANSSLMLPFLGMLREVTGKTPSIIAQELDVTVPFLTLIVQHRESVPDSWRTEMIERAVVRWNVDRQRARRSLEHPDQQEIAASRRTAYSTRKISYREILKRSGLGTEAQQYWLTLAEAK